jgi:hypothetical protein
MDWKKSIYEKFTSLNKKSNATKNNKSIGQEMSPQMKEDPRNMEKGFLRAQRNVI